MQPIPLQTIIYRNMAPKAAAAPKVCGMERLTKIFGPVSGRLHANQIANEAMIVFW